MVKNPITGNKSKVSKKTYIMILAGIFTATTAVCSWIKEQHGWTVDPAHIVCSPGVVPALFMLVAALCEAGDGIIVMPPVYYPFYGAVKTNLSLIHILKLSCHWNIFQNSHSFTKQIPAFILLLFPHNPFSFS